MRDLEEWALARECLRLANGNISRATEIWKLVEGKPRPSINPALRQIVEDFAEIVRNA
jgi:hypothetical protein